MTARGPRRGLVRAFTGAILMLAVAVAPAQVATADEGWTIDRYDAQILVRTDGSLHITEAIDVDFGAQQHHGIFRRIPVRYHFDEQHDRVYDLRTVAITDAGGRAWTYDRSDDGADVVFKIGDPDRTVSGKQTYRIVYDVGGALNGFTDHDELFWNVNGEWPVRTRALSAHVQLERGAITQVACFQGPLGSQEACRIAIATGSADASATRLLGVDEQLTVVVGFPKGLVPAPAPTLEQRKRDIGSWFDLTPLSVGGAALVIVAGIGSLAWLWVSRGRDPAGPETIVPEYEPPQKLRPAEVGLLIDESADAKDLTATIVDLAVRGYLRIEEIAAHGIFSGRDWKLVRLRDVEGELAPYERTLLTGLFAGGDVGTLREELREFEASLGPIPTPGKIAALGKYLGQVAPVDATKMSGEVRLSDLRGTFHGTLAHAEDELYNASVASGWFPADPTQVRQRFAVLGCVVVILGIVAVTALGTFYGGALPGLAFVAVGLLMLPLSRAMPKRTAKGRDLFWHMQGFRRYMETAETDRQRFAEKENIFAQYLPYAIVFGLVSKWAAAFSGLDAQRATSGWYTGTGLVNIPAFSSSLSSFSSSLGTAISSTPGGSGSSGFGGGGGSGGGGGGGGGGSW